MSDQPQEPSDVSNGMPLRDDNPSDVDLLGFEDVVDVVEDIVTRKDLDPVTVGINAPWGGGKTTILQLLQARLDKRGDVMCVLISPWEYDRKTDPTTTLIDEVLGRLNVRLENTKSAGDQVKDLLKRLRDRVKVAKALKLAANAALTFTLPPATKLLDVFDESTGAAETPSDPTLQGFRQQFSEIMGSEGLNLERVVMLVDDLDRSLPDTVVETLEAIKLFLSVKKMAFVLAADEDNVAHAIGRRLERTGQPITARLYLEKIVQVPVRVPALSLEQTEEYLALLMLADAGTVDDCIQRIKESRPSAVGRLRERLGEALPNDRVAEIDLAQTFAPLLHRQTTGNPRRIKRFLNAFWLRRAFAGARGVELEAPVLAKLMLAELHYQDLFGQLLGWLSAGVVAERVGEIEAGEGDYSQQVFEWGRLEPSLSGEDLSKYLHLAASLRGQTLEEVSLPSDLRDVAAQLAHTSDTQRADGLKTSKKLSMSERAILARFLAASLRHQRAPDAQRSLADSISGLAEDSAVAASAAEELRRLAHGTVTAGVPLALLARNRPDELASLVRGWSTSEEAAELTKNASREALRSAGLEG
jgi:hypothetical protein